MALRVVFVAPWGERLGGAEEGLWQALRHFDRGRLVPTAVFLSPGEFEREVAALGVETAVLPAGRLREVRRAGQTVRRLGAALRCRQPDLVVNWSAKAQLYGAPAALSVGLGNRIVWWQHMIPDGHWTDRLATLLPARAVGCWSQAGEAAQAATWPRRRTFVVNPGIVVGGGGGDDGDSDGLRRELGIPERGLVAGIVGRLQPWKGQDRFLRALAEVRSRGHDVHGLVVGGDAYERSPDYARGLDELVVDLGLAEAVTMTGQVPDARPYFELMDIAVNASEAEPFGIVLIEAMAAGAVVVAVGRGGPTEIVEDGVTGRLVESGDPERLADAIEGLLSDSAGRLAIAAAGKRRCAERFSAEAMATRLTTCLEEVAGV